MTAKQTETHGEVPEGVYVSAGDLGFKYMILALYGWSSAAVGMSTPAAVSGAWYGIALPLLIGLAGTAAYLSTRVLRWAHPRLETVGVFVMVVGLLSYIVTILARTFVDGDLARLPTALLPLALMTVPWKRLRVLVNLLWPR